MYSVVKIGGHQYRVQAGDNIDVQKLDANAGDTIELDQVLFVGGDKPQLGTPVVAGAKVTAEVIKQDRARKVIVFKRSPGKWRKKNGHRQHFTALKIKSIDDGQGNVAKA